MKQEDIRGLAELMSTYGLTKLKVEEAEVAIELERSGAGQKETMDSIPINYAPAVQKDLTDAALYTVTAPLVGVFYAAPSAEAAPYVSVGDTVRAGDTLCIVEAMKVMNEIVSEKDGVVEEVCAANKDVVEYGMPLFKIRIS